VVRPLLRRAIPQRLKSLTKSEFLSGMIPAERVVNKKLNLVRRKLLTIC